MNKIYTFLLAIVLVCFGSCEDKSDFVISEADASFNIVTPISGTAIILDRTNQDNIALALIWKRQQVNRCYLFSRICLVRI